MSYVVFQLSWVHWYFCKYMAEISIMLRRNHEFRVSWIHDMCVSYQSILEQLTSNIEKPLIMFHRILLLLSLMPSIAILLFEVFHLSSHYLFDVTIFSISLGINCAYLLLMIQRRAVIARHIIFTLITLLSLPLYIWIH